MIRYRVAGPVAVRYWDGESTAVVRRHDAGTTHLIHAGALAVLETAADRLNEAQEKREIAHALGVDPELDAELQRIIESLVQSGLLIAEQDDAHAR